MNSPEVARYRVKVTETTESYSDPEPDEHEYWLDENAAGLPRSYATIAEAEAAYEYWLSPRDCETMGGLSVSYSYEVIAVDADGVPLKRF